MNDWDRLASDMPGKSVFIIHHDAIRKTTTP